MSTLSAPFISVIVPVYNEGDRLISFVHQIFDIVGHENEVIAVNGGSDDESINQLRSLAKLEENLSLISAPKGRALQMNAGAKLATAANLVFLHADTVLPECALTELTHFSTSKLTWGRFDVCFDNRAIPYKIISWFINNRSRLTSIATGDQAIFVRRDIFEKINGYVEQPLMEDIDLSSRLKNISRPFCISKAVTTSARKWEQEGLIKTVWLMWKLRAAYARGVSPEALVKVYYKR